jgi:hypothetical protein
MQLIKLFVFSAILISTSCFAHDTAKKVDGGEIGNAFVPFESKIAAFAIEYPHDWQRSDLSQLINFYDPKEDAPEKNDFLSVMTSQIKGVSSENDLLQHLRASLPDARWEKTEFAGLNGFRSEVGGVQVAYLLREPEILLSIRYRAKNSEKSEELVAHMLGSFRLL